MGGEGVETTDSAQVRVCGACLGTRRSVPLSTVFCGSGIRCLLTSGSGRSKKLGSGSGMNNPDHISQSLETNFLVRILQFFDADPGSGMEKIRDKHPGSATLIFTSVVDPRSALIWLS